MISNVVGRTPCRQITLQVTTSRALRPMMVRTDMAKAVALVAQHHRARLIDSVPAQPGDESADRLKARARVHLHRAPGVKARRADFAPCGPLGLEQCRPGDTE